ncbi:PDZ and LIM domain protein 7-like protein, partial [Dinothrombium tinctorium]
VRLDDQNPIRLRRIPCIVPSGVPLTDQEKEIYLREKEREHLKIINQPHRTFPVIQPQPKPKHDYPQGSYLKYVRDPTWNQSSYTKTPVIPLDQILHTRQHADQLGGFQNDARIVNVQYNSPLPVYSNETVKEQVLYRTPPIHRPQPQKQPNQPPQLISAPSASPTNLRESPTLRMIHEEEEEKRRTYRPHSPQPPSQSSTFKTLMHQYYR